MTRGKNKKRKVNEKIGNISEMTSAIKTRKTKRRKNHKTVAVNKRDKKTAKNKRVA